MSLGYLRSDALTDLANCGKTALDKIEIATRELLGAVPGSWMPDEVVATLELVERAYNNASEDGKNSIVLVLLRIVDNLGLAWLRRPLHLVESRQLLGSMELGTVWSERYTPLAMRLAKVLWDTKNAPSLFSARIKTVPEVIGENGSLGQFAHSLWGRLPKTICDRTELNAKSSRFGYRKKELFENLAAAYRDKSDMLMKPEISSDLKFFTSRIEGKPGIIQLRVHDQWRLVGICPIRGGNDAFEVADNQTDLSRFFEMLGQDIAQTPILDVGTMEMSNDNRLNLIEGAYTCIRNHFFHSVGEFAAARTSNQTNAAEIASILLHKIWDEKLPEELIEVEARVSKIDNDLFAKVEEIALTFEPVLTSVES